VVKHEAMAVRRARAAVTSEELDLDAVPALAQRSVEERLEAAERVERSAEVMRRLKRDEARALMLKAEGLSYLEIGERLGWTYTNIKCPLGPSS
jgi:DNA-directed RNA polymerase specialized sigma24 family protein